jgi:hypothetical protein
MGVGNLITAIRSNDSDRSKVALGVKSTLEMWVNGLR